MVPRWRYVREACDLQGVTMRSEGVTMLLEGVGRLEGRSQIDDCARQGPVLAAAGKGMRAEQERLLAAVQQHHQGRLQLPRPVLHQHACCL